MSKNERRSYDKSFKLMAVELQRNGKPAGTVAKELVIGVDMVRRWSREYSAHDTRSFPGMANRI
jgi:transposase